jgi:hypothetical protein
LTSEKVRYVTVLVLCIILSLVGIGLAAYRNRPLDGGRGGALAVAVALFNLFIDRNSAAILLRLRTKTFPAINKRLARLEATQKRKQEGIENLTTKARQQPLGEVVNRSAKNQKTQNFFLAAATFAGTIVWGFGDVFAQFLIKQCWWRSLVSLAFVVLSPWPLLQPFPFAKCVEPPPDSASQIASPSHCVVNGLPEGLPVNAQYPSACLDSIIDHALHDQPILILVEGRSDKRALRPGLKRIYGDNFTLAYQRGVTLKKYLIDRYRSRLPQSSTQGEQVEKFSSRIAVTAGGPNYIESKTSVSDESEDRCVEVFSYWNTNPNL